MIPISQFVPTSVKFVFTDIDDTLTEDGKLPAASFDALWRLQNAGFEVIPVTGRPAGWCDLIARFWPVSGIVGENGAFYFRLHQKMRRYFVDSLSVRKENRSKLKDIAKQILRSVPNARISSDQFCRISDLAIDFCEDIPHLTDFEIQKIKNIFEEHGATAKISSIHVNGWFGKYDKLSTCLAFLKNEFNVSKNTVQDSSVFIGDSPNDEPMFEFFKNSVGVANVSAFKGKLKSLPRFVCRNSSAQGFCEFVEQLLKQKK